MQDLLETWDINNRIHLYLLDGIEEQHLSDLLSSKGRNVGEQFTRIHNARLMWLNAAAPELMKGLEKMDKEKTNITKKLLADSLNKSAGAIRGLLEKGLKEGKIKGFKPHPTAFLGYIISHESRHRGQLILALKQSGHPLDKKIQFGIWE